MDTEYRIDTNINTVYTVYYDTENKRKVKVKGPNLIMKEL